MFIPAVRTARAKPPPDTDVSSAQIRKERLQNKPDLLIQACKGKQRASKDDWIEWLRRFDAHYLLLFLLLL